MKKLIAVFAALAVGSAAVSAVPAPADQANARTIQSIQAGVSENAAVTALAQTEDSLFADVQAVSLTDDEAQAVTGDGWNPLASIAKVIAKIIEIIIKNPPTPNPNPPKPVPFPMPL